MTRHPWVFVSLVLATLVPVLSGCSREESSSPTTPVARASPTQPPQAVTAVIGTPTPEPSPTPSALPTTPGTPAPVAPTATPRLVNGLQVVDEPGTWVVREPGGLRIRSTPNVAPDNVVGSVPQNTEFPVLGRVLNGQEAETGGGTVWLIVGPNQYMYAAPGSVERAR
jgi:hypothetical protein